MSERKLMYIAVIGHDYYGPFDTREDARQFLVENRQHPGQKLESFVLYPPD